MQRPCDARFARYWRICLARRTWRVRVSPEDSRLAGSQPALSTRENLKSEGSRFNPEGGAGTGTESHKPETCGTIVVDGWSRQADANERRWSLQSSGKRVSAIRRETVRSGSCRPDRIDALISGAKKVRRTSRVT